MFGLTAATAVITLIAFLVIFFVKKYARIIFLASKIPGPPALPIIGNALLFFGKPPEENIEIVGNLARHYGDTYRLWLGPELNVMMKGLNDVEMIMSSNKLIDKAGEYDVLRPWLREGLLVSAGKKWFKRRKMITPAFHFNVLEGFVQIFERQSNILIERLKKFKPTDTVELYPFITLCALDVICEAAMGTSANAQLNSDSKYVQAVKTISMVHHKRMLDIFYRIEFLFRVSKLSKVHDGALQTIHNFTRNVIERRRDEILKDSKENNGQQSQENQKANDIGMKKKMAFLDILLQSEIDGEPLSNLDIQEEVDTFMFEGHDTTTSAINFCLYNLALYPEEQRKCFEEISEVLGNDVRKSPTLSDLNSLNYLEFAVKETLRLYPSVPVIGRKITEECEINKWRIPAGTNIAVVPLIMGRDERIFPNAEDFKPERFNVETSADKRNPYAYIPFSAGPRNCIGQKFAMLEVKSVVSKILRNFEIALSNPEKPILTAELILKSRNKLMFILKPRNNNE